MRWFKKRVPEAAAAQFFVSTTFEYVNAQWPKWAAIVGPPVEGENADVKALKVNFATAMLAIQLHALPNLTGARQAERLRAHVNRLFDGPAGESQVFSDLLTEFDRIWTDALEWACVERPPWCAVVEAIFGMEGIQIGLVEQMQIGSALVGCGWWKSFLADHKLVEG